MPVENATCPIDIRLWAVSVWCLIVFSEIMLDVKLSNSCLFQVNVIRQAASSLEEDDPIRKQVDAWLENLPSTAILNSLHSRHATPNTTPQGTPPGTPSSSKKTPKG